MTADEIWEECICDSLGDMNIFADVNDLGEFMEGILPDIKKAASRNKAPTQTRVSPDGKASRETNQYTEKEYRDFGWARANDVITASESEDLRSKFASAVSKLSKYPMTKDGDYMISIGEDVDNKIAYMNGNIRKPIITRVIEIHIYDETLLSEKRSEIYAAERQGIPQETSAIFTRYNPSDFPYKQWDKQRSGNQNDGYNNQFRTERAGSGSQASRVKKYTFESEVSNQNSSLEDGKASQELDFVDFAEIKELSFVTGE